MLCRLKNKFMNNLKAIRLKLRIIRKSKGLTLKEVSDKTGVSLCYISEIERGISNPSLKSICKLLNFYGYYLSLELKKDIKINPTPSQG